MFDLPIVEPEVCPYLGLPNDARTRFTFADPAHRCHVGTKPIPIDLRHQGTYCLTSDYPICKRFRTRKATGRQGSSLALTPGSSLALVVGVTGPSSRGGRTAEGGGRGRGWTLRSVASFVAILAVAVVVGGIRSGVIGGSPADGGEPGAIASPAAAAPTVAAAPTSASTTPAPATPTSLATRTPRSASIIHLVVRGENLISIASYYGVTVKAIQDANNIPDPSLIRVGDRLVIPPPP